MRFTPQESEELYRLVVEVAAQDLRGLRELLLRELRLRILALPAVAASGSSEGNRRSASRAEGPRRRAVLESLLRKLER